MVVALVVLGLRPESFAPGQALEPPGPTPSTSAQATPTPSRPTASRRTPSRPSTSATPAPQRTRTAAQRAAGLAADGSRLRVPAAGSGRYTGSRVERRPRAGSGRVILVDLQVEREVPVGADDAARLVGSVLDDDRSWRGTRGAGGVRFRMVARGERADLHAYLVTPTTTDRLCAPLQTRGEVSCQTGNRVVLNARRWVDGAASFGDDTAGYRGYLVNHEFGHALGRGHVGCPGRGRPAPVMLQQTKGLGGCRANSWPRGTRG